MSILKEYFLNVSPFPLEELYNVTNDLGNKIIIEIFILKNCRSHYSKYTCCIITDKDRSKLNLVIPKPTTGWLCPRHE